MNSEVKIHPRRMSRWRNGLAHWTSNSKVAGSSPARDGTFFFFFFPFLYTCTTVLHLEYVNVSMWARILPRWRIFGLFSPRSYSCKKTNYEVCSAHVVSSAESMLLHNKSTNDSALNCGLQWHDCTRDEALILLFQSSLQEHLSITRMLWVKWECKPVVSLKLPAYLEKVSFLDPSRIDVCKEEPMESLDEEGDTLGGKWCSSILKKRRSKMNKHKYKKRRKKHKFLRRRLGK